MEDFLAGPHAAAPDERRRASELLAGFVESLRTILKKIEAGGGEDPDASAAFRARHAALLSPPPAAGAGDAEQIVQQLDRFFSAHGDVLTYFGSEMRSEERRVGKECRSWWSTNE